MYKNFSVFFKSDKLIFGSVLKHFVTLSIHLGTIRVAQMHQNSEKVPFSSENTLGYFLGYF
jgi:hypothetical protein